MKCPKCQDEMVEMKIQGVDLDFCSACCGIWYDKGELAFTTETTEDVPDIKGALKEGKQTEMMSPAAEGVHLVEVEFIPFSGVMVDVCPETHGVYLDRGELIKIEELSVEREVFEKVGRTVQELQQQGYEIMPRSE